MALNFYTVVLMLTLFSCKNSKNRETYLFDALEQKHIAPNWRLQLPPNAQISRFDSTKRFISTITLPNDSLLIKCELLHIDIEAGADCSYSETVAKTQKAADGGICQGDGTTEIAYEAVVNAATKMAGVRGDWYENGRQFVTFSVIDCPSGEYLTLYFEQISSEHTKLIDNIIRSTKFESR